MPIYVSLETIAYYSYAMIAVAFILGYIIGAILTYKISNHKERKKKCGSHYRRQ